MERLPVSNRYSTGARALLKLSESRERGKHEKVVLKADEGEWEQTPYSRALH